MNNSKFDVLAAQVLSGEATSEQKLEFEKLLKASKENQIAFEKLKRAWNINIDYDKNGFQKQKEILWRQYQTHRRSQNVRSLQHNFILKVAAVILLMITTGFVIFRLYEQNVNHYKQQVVVEEIIKETKPGEKLKTKLPDGTSVHLNAGSKLIFPSHFSDSTRVVRLEGEGFFDVAKNKEKPFTVRTKTMDITALGTAFNVNAYRDNQKDHVALASGKLLIKNTKDQKVRIDSGQTITLSRADYSFSESELNYLNHIAWKDGILYFNNNTFSEIKKILERNYGVEFIMDGDMVSIQNTYTGIFKDEVLDNVLKILSFSMGFKYEINGKEILIKNN